MLTYTFLNKLVGFFVLGGFSVCFQNENMGVMWGGHNNIFSVLDF